MLALLRGLSHEFFGNDKRALLEDANKYLTLFSAMALFCFLSADQSFQSHQTRSMVSSIEQTAVVIGLYTGHSKIDDNVLKAMAAVPRENFIHDKWQHYAYSNVSLPLQNKSQIMAEPYVTAMMIDMVDASPTDKILEIGYGTGYYAAILSKMSHKVYSIRMNKENDNIPVPEKQGYVNVNTKISSNIKAWKNQGKFDAIIIKQVQGSPPTAAIQQLKVGGKLVMPIFVEGNPSQTIKLFTKTGSGKLKEKAIILVTLPFLYQGTEI